MDNLPQIPKDWDKINNLIDKLSPYDLELLEKMDEHSQKWFFDTAKTRLKMRKKQSKSERFRALKFFFTVAALCTFGALSILATPTSKLSALFWITTTMFFLVVAIQFLSIFIEVIKSAIKKAEFSLEEHLFSRNAVIDGWAIISIFILALNDLF